MPPTVSSPPRPPVSESSGGAATRAFGEHGGKAGKNEDFLPLCCVLALSGAVLVVGLAGTLPGADPLNVPLLQARQDAAEQPLEEIEFTEADLFTSEDAPPEAPAEETAAEEPPAPEEVAEEIPEVTEALAVDDVFQIPAPPIIESVRMPVDPARPKPEPKPKPPVAAPKPAPARPAARPAGVAGGVPAGGGGTVEGAKGRGGKAYRPKPPYVPSVKARGIQGTLELLVSWDATGRVVSAVVTRTMGSSEQDNFAANFVRQRWRFPAGAAGSQRAPLIYRIQ